MKRFKTCPLCDSSLENGSYFGGPSRYWERCSEAGCYELELDGVNQMVETFFLSNRRVLFLGQFLDANSAGPGYRGSIQVETQPGTWRRVGEFHDRRPAVEKIRKMIQDTIDSDMMVMI